ncbi:hypothetical protein GEMRC1_007625 [Eukaryota sp. GEM-RC1]
MGHSHNDDANTRKSRALIIMMCLIGSYFFVEIIVGIIINSLALISDALHSLSDMVALAVGLICVRMAKKEPCAKFTYGLHRAEVLGGLINGVLLLIIVVYIFFEGIHRMIELEQVENPLVMTITSAIGLCLNLIGLWLFGHDHHSHDCGHSHKHETEAKNPVHDHSHDHDECHGHDHHHDHSKKEEHQQDVNMRGVFLHILGDALGSVAVLLSGLFIHFTDSEYAHLADPIASMLFAIIIFIASSPLVLKCLRILVQSTPPHINAESLTESIIKIPGILGVHDFHIWQLSSQKIIATCHIDVSSSKVPEYRRISSLIVSLLHEAGVHETTVQPCFVDDSSMRSSPFNTCPSDTCGSCKTVEEETVDVVVD